MEFICLVIVRQLFVSGMFGDVIFIGEEWPDTTHLKDALSSVHDCKLVLAHQFLSSFLVVHSIAAAGATGIAGVVEINGLLAEHSRHLFQCAGFFAAQEQCAVTIAHNGVGSIFIDGLQLRLTLQYDRSGDLPASDRCNQFIKFWNLPYILWCYRQALYPDFCMITMQYRVHFYHISKDGTLVGDTRGAVIFCKAGSNPTRYNTGASLGRRLSRYWNGKIFSPILPPDALRLTCVHSAQTPFCRLCHVTSTKV